MSVLTWGSNNKTIWEYPPEEQKIFFISLGIMILVILAGVGIYYTIKYFKEKIELKRELRREEKEWKKYHKDN